MNKVPRHRVRSQRAAAEPQLLANSLSGARIMSGLFSLLRFGTFFLMAVLLSPQLLAQEYSAGYEMLRIIDETRERPVHLDIWYPVMLQQEQVHSYGISAGRVVIGEF